MAVNLGSEDAEVQGLAGTVLVGTDRGRDGEAVSGSLRLAPGEGAVVEVS